MNSLRHLITLALVLVTGASIVAQEASEPAKSSVEKAARPKDMLELGIRPTYMFVSGDVDSKPGFGAGLHFRKSLDYVFSLRFDGIYGQMEGDNELNDVANPSFTNTYLGGTVMGVIALNNFRFDRARRSVSYYAMIGGGGNMFEVEYNGLANGESVRDAKLESEFAPHAAVGAGIAFRLSSRINIALEYQGIIPFGDRADQIDGLDKGSAGGNFRDIINTAGISFNFNLGNKSQRSEPLYWVNAFDPIAEEINKVASRVDDATRDSDGDGIVDAIDQEPNTPANVPVDTKGRTLDSDKDGVPDFRDREPFFPPRPGEEVDENGIVTNRIDKPVTEERVQEMIDAAISNARLNNTTVVEGSDLRELFIPMIYFPLNKYTVKYSDYGTLANVAQVMEKNPGLRLVVQGFTDKVGDTDTNDRLSYLRAKAVIDHLVNQHGVSRSRLVLQWSGEDQNVVPLNQTYLNRRVEFHTATAEDYEQEPPANVDVDGGGY
ncbi:MAG: OmpA family protein [Bacteroidota bacterium]